MFAYRKMRSCLLFIVLIFPLLGSASIPIKSMVVFGDSLSDVGNTTHLLKSLRHEEDPAFLVTPFKHFIINKMNDFANEYYVPELVLETGLSLVNEFFDHEVAYYMTAIIAQLRLVPIFPEKPYWNYRFSNGRVWNEYLADMLAIQQDDAGAYTNKAFGGSWAATYDYQLTVWNLIRHPVASIKNLIVGKLIPPSLGIATQAYLLEHRKVNPKSAYFIFAGANDYLNVLRFERNYEPLVMSQYVDSVLDGLAAAVLKLEHAGAQQFVIMGLPHLGETPKYINTTDREVLNAAIDQHNERLQQRIEEWKIQYPEDDFLFIDMQGYLDKVVASPDSFGFTNTSDVCVDVTFPVFSAFAQSPFADNYVLQYAQVLQYRDKRLAAGEHNFHVCKTADRYLFWDEVHPSTRAHRYLAYEICKSMQEHGYAMNCKVPESIL